MKNITLSVDDETYRQARLLAAQREQSVSALVRDLINDSITNPALVAREPRAQYLVKPVAKVAVSSTSSKRGTKKIEATSVKAAKEMSLLEFMRASPLYGLEIKFERDKSLPREISFDE
jgi:Ribbon-helix-helix protein, copG family